MVSQMITTTRCLKARIKTRMVAKRFIEMVKRHLFDERL
ncbi:hypothetical protein RT43_GL000895 [Enterococcus italicus DSM 15952]|nr:hypothetical protein RT43_GL000895 [Enterococcus italicus DSM 15952]